MCPTTTSHTSAHRAARERASALAASAHVTETLRLVEMRALLPEPTPRVALRTFALFLLHFHLSEFILVVRFNPRSAGLRSLCLSRSYCVAMSLGVLEFYVEHAMLGELKERWTASAYGFGVFMCVFGEWLRKSAMITAGTSFTHEVQTSRRAAHVLVRDGVYAHARHPGYLGWFIWAVGTQVIMANAMSAVAFAIVTWRFFKRRIAFEEMMLREMFPDYDVYAKRTRTWIPFIK